MFSSLPYCNVEKLTNDEFAQSFGYESFLQMVKLFANLEKQILVVAFFNFNFSNQ